MGNGNGRGHFCDCAGAIDDQSLRYARDLANIYLEEKARQNELKAAGERMRAVINAMDDGMAATDENGFIIEANRKFLRFFAAERRSVIGEHPAELIGDDFARKLSGTEVRRGETGRFEFTHGKDSRIMRADYTRMHNGWSVFVFHDVTVEHRLANMKDEFLGILSHELRTPLNGILGFASLLTSEPDKLAPDQLECVRMIESSGRRMFKIVDELLKFADFTGHVHFEENEDVELEELLSKLAEELEPLAAKRGVDFILPERSGPKVLYGKRSMLEEMLRQVLHNAVQYNLEGGLVRVSVKGGAAGLTVTVEDQGPGISGEDQERVFESFYQVEGYLSRNNEGLGLGLSIARRVARMHGGELTLANREEHGLAVTLRLPLKGAAQGSTNDE
jgi:PAS domain S-box-containing protein